MKRFNIDKMHSCETVYYIGNGREILSLYKNLKSHITNAVFDKWENNELPNIEAISMQGIEFYYTQKILHIRVMSNNETADFLWARKN